MVPKQGSPNGTPFAHAKYDQMSNHHTFTKEHAMAHHGNVQLTFVIVAPPELEAEGDRIFKNHAVWMEKTHHRDGDKALLVYDVSKVAELSNPMDPTSAPTGNTVFILAEIYASPAGIEDHFEQANSNWEEFENFKKWMGACQVSITPCAPVVHSLW